jgi:trans-aconitate methyltransferase
MNTPCSPAETSYDFRTKYTKTNVITRTLLEGFFGALRDLTANLQIDNALEVGCGEGFSTLRLRQMLRPGVDLAAIDVEQRLVDEARTRNPGLRIDTGSIYSLQHAPRSVDLVLALEVLEHLDEPERGLAELCRTSRRWVALSVPREPIWRALNMARGKYLSEFGNTPGHLQHWSAKSFHAFVSRFAAVHAVKTPLPWTMLLAEVPPPGK